MLLTLITASKITSILPMGCFKPPSPDDDNKQSKDANKTIEKQLQKDKQLYRSTHRLLLLGTCWNFAYIYSAGICVLTAIVVSQFKIVTRTQCVCYLWKLFGFDVENSLVQCICAGLYPTIVLIHLRYVQF